MTQFASKTPRDLNHDPQPFVGADLSRKSRYSRFAPRFDPRPEFDHVQHNEPNPILVAAREDGAIEWLEQIIYYGDSLSGGWIGDMKVLPDHIDHARRVLERLARLAAQEALEA